MQKKFITYLDNYKGKIFDTSKLGKTSKEADLKLLADPLELPSAKYIPLNPTMKIEARKLVEALIALGVLKVTDKKANSTIFLIQKRSGSWRLIADLRQYNSKLEDYVVHLPSPYELICKISTFSIFSYCDFPDAYFNIPLSPMHGS